MTESKIQLTECPRDAMQGVKDFIPTDIKAAYINLLLQVGFDTIDFGSFVSAKAIPQMQDTAQVLQKLDLSSTESKLLAIIGNYHGAEDAAKHNEITYLGFPFSISETFQQRNTNTSMGEAFETVKRIKDLCDGKNKHILVYLSMGFGNRYGDEWSKELVLQWAGKLINEGVKYISLADTIGIADPTQIANLYTALSSQFTETVFGVHLHSTPNTWFEKVQAAYQSGCKRFDTALKGYGGCPMAKDELTGNIATENVIAYLQSQKVDLGLNLDKLREAMEYADNVFNHYA
ncbi:MAG TPA: hydroxymethylglutaryl-CoA lyase [Mucilaginibacter sp.]|jgi:hydroxymethylglutaryl-CoA lyase|nr:hydroxymethylglutaryl-CoA lyase [Mucilaginibacter sp.]